MKILKKGKPVQGWSEEFICTGLGNGMGGCGAILLVEFNDLFETSHSDYTGDTEYFTTFKCAQCGVLNDITVYRGPKVMKQEDGSPSRCARLAK